MKKQRVIDAPVTAARFKEMWGKAGNKTNSRGRPILPCFDYGADLKGESLGSLDGPVANRKVRNAKKQFDINGDKIADSKWELQCLEMLEAAGLRPEKQRAFEILPAISGRGLKRALNKRRWHPDFTFPELKVVADAKGWVTEIARVKIHIFMDKYPGWAVYQLKTREDVYSFIDVVNYKYKNGRD